MDGDVVGIVVNGHVTLIGQGDEGVDAIEPVWTEIYGSSPFAWGVGASA
jgi:hypothetical protein